MTVIINIGLKASTRIPEQDRLHEADILAALPQEFVKRYGVIRESATERTLVVKAFPGYVFSSGNGTTRVDWWTGRLYWLAVKTQQDCIAFTIDGKGYLVGPAAHLWGEFNPDFFLTE